MQIGGVDVVRVLRRGSTAVHFTQEPLEEGAEVEIEVDWDRRFDHMQQHSGMYHLLNSLHKATSLRPLSHSPTPDNCCSRPALGF